MIMIYDIESKKKERSNKPHTCQSH